MEIFFGSLQVGDLVLSRFVNNSLKLKLLSLFPMQSNILKRIS
jgi:hypothetical protein